MIPTEDTEVTDWLMKRFDVSDDDRIKIIINPISSIENINKTITTRKQNQILTNTQMLIRLPIAFALVKAGNASENLLNEFPQIIYALYWAKKITKKVYNSIMNSKI